jgi:hypothetical protein
VFVNKYTERKPPFKGWRSDGKLGVKLKW